MGTRRHLLYPRILKQPLCLAEEVVDVLEFSGFMNAAQDAAIEVHPYLSRYGCIKLDSRRQRSPLSPDGR